MRYVVSVWHGEGRSIFAVVDTFAPESEQPAVVSTHATREAADDAVEGHVVAARGRALDELAGALDRAEFARKVAKAWENA